MLAAGIATVLLVVIGVVVYLAWAPEPRRATPEPSAAAPVSHTEAVPPPAMDPRARISSALLGLECAHASFDFDPTGVLTVSGQVRDSAQRSELERRLRAIAGISDLRMDLALVPPPYCEVTSLVARLSNAGSGPLEVRVTRPKPPLRIGQEPVHLEVVGPDFDSNIAVDVWSLQDKQPTRLDVAHLLPHAGYSLSDAFKPNERKTIRRISDGANPVDIKVYPPPGKLLITAVASERPLVQRDRPLTSDPTQYLAAIRAEADARGASARIATWYGFVEVLP
jgi:hypothetical protein